MKQKLVQIVFVTSLVLLVAGFACSTSDPAIKAGRDTAAAAQGAIQAAQAQCAANATAKVCPVIPQAAQAQNLLVTALETACGWSPTNPPADPNAKCVVVQGALPALTAATQNVNTILQQLKGAMGN